MTTLFNSRPTPSLVPEAGSREHRVVFPGVFGHHQQDLGYLVYTQWLPTPLLRGALAPSGDPESEGSRNPSKSRLTPLSIAILLHYETIVYWLHIGEEELVQAHTTRDGSRSGSHPPGSRAHDSVPGALEPTESEHNTSLSSYWPVCGTNWLCCGLCLPWWLDR